MAHLFLFSLLPFEIPTSHLSATSDYLDYLKGPGIILTRPSTSDEDPDLGSQDPGDFRMEDAVAGGVFPNSDCLNKAFYSSSSPRKTIEYLATYIFLILYLSHAALIIV